MQTILGQKFGVAQLAATLAAWGLHYALISSGAGAETFSVPIAISGALTACSLMIVASLSNLSRMALLAALSIFMLAQFLMMQLEASIFSLGKLDMAATLGLLIVSVVLASPFAVASIFGTQEPSQRRASTPVFLSNTNLLRIAVCATAFPLVYFFAGITILPFVEQFYAGLIPPFHELILWQCFRGLVFTLSVIPLVLCCSQSRITAAVVFAVVFPVVGGVAPLLLPNAAMPPEVRFVHGFEIAASYVVYGAILGFLLQPISWGQSNQVATS